jgi:branched-chain amino acid transport system ATP-binding protein
MWRLSTAMHGLGAQLQAKPVAEDAAALAAMLEYLNVYADRFHHPKEDQYLLRLLRQRSPDAQRDADELQEEHRSAPGHLALLRDRARAMADGRAPLQTAFFDDLRTFIDGLRDHIRREEKTVMPLARRVLTAEDWQEIDAAFLDNDDPLFGDKPRAEFDALRRRIVQLAPEPYGLGGTAPAQDASPGAATAATVLQVRGLSSHYGRIQALKGVDLDVAEGQLVALVGANGAGKTTLLRTLSGVQPASGGEILFCGTSISRQRPDARVRAGICQVPEGRQVFGPLAIEDNLLLGAYTRTRAEAAEGLEQAYALFPILKEKRLLPAGTLSGGQQQMLAMARALMARPKLLLLDEPSMGLAPLLIEEVFRVVKSLKGQGITILLVEQNAHAALSIADKGYVLETGSIVLSGTGTELLANEQVKRAYLGM